MKIRPISDIHLDSIVKFVKNKNRENLAIALDIIPKQDDDKETILVLAGDIWEGTKSLSFGNEKFSWIEEQANRFRHVIAVLGNHDFWGEDLPNIYEKYWVNSKHIKNFTLLEAALGKSEVIIENTKFVGSTLWTNLDNYNPNVAHTFDNEIDGSGRKAFRDRTKIRVSPNYKKYSSRDIINYHRKAIANLKQSIEKDNLQTILISHMAPTMKSLGTEPPYSIDDYVYASNLEETLLSYPNLTHAIHGHIHKAVFTEVAGTNIIANPKGYFNEDIIGFNETLVFESETTNTCKNTSIKQKI